MKSVLRGLGSLLTFLVLHLPAIMFLVGVSVAVYATFTLSTVAGLYATAAALITIALIIVSERG